MNLESRHCLFAGFFRDLAFSLAVVVFLIVGKAWAEDVVVTCTPSSPTGIQAKLDSWAEEKNVPHSITIHGVCTESVLVEGFRGLVLGVDASGSGIRRVAKPNAWEWTPALQVRGSEGVSLNGLTFYEASVTVENPLAALVSLSRSNVAVSDCTIKGSLSGGLDIGDNSNVDIVRSTIEDNKGSGIGAGGHSRVNISYSWWDGDRTFIQRNGSVSGGGAGISAGSGAVVNVVDVKIEDNLGGGVISSGGAVVNLGGWGDWAPTIERNGALQYTSAVLADTGGEVWVIPHTKIQNNPADGAVAQFGGRLYVCCGPDTTISNNNGLGVRAYMDGQVIFWGPALVENNRRGGLDIYSSKVYFNPGAVIRGNGDLSVPNSLGGIFLEFNSTAQGTFTVTDNYGPGVFIKAASAAHILENSTITGNKGYGVQLEMNSTADFRGGSTVTGHKPFDLLCTTGSTAGAAKGTRLNIGKMNCPGWSQVTPMPAWMLPTN
jgi:hypothetical protein